MNVDFDEKKLIALRIKDMQKSEGFSLKEFAEALGINEKTLGSYTRAAAFPTWSFMMATYDYGFNPDYVLSGEGEMYRANRSGSSRTTYRDNGIAVHTNNGNIGVGTQNNDSGGRGNRICQFVHWWMEKHSEDEQAWLEQQIARAVPEYDAWKAEKNKEKS